VSLSGVDRECSSHSIAASITVTIDARYDRRAWTYNELNIELMTQSHQDDCA